MYKLGNTCDKHSIYEDLGLSPRPRLDPLKSWPDLVGIF